MRSRFVVAAGVVTLGLLISQAATKSQSPAFDVVIRGGRVVDGTGNPWFTADIGIKGDSIAALAPHLDATGARTIDATGLVVSPGFIDVHSHSEEGREGQDVIGNPAAENNVRQGDDGDRKPGWRRIGAHR